MYCPMRPIASLAMTTKISEMSNRLLSAVDLAIDFATLGEYGLEPADGPCRERSGHASDWEAFRRPTAARTRRGDCPRELDRRRASA
jgi:hypothetical protein